MICLFTVKALGTVTRKKQRFVSIVAIEGGNINVEVSIPLKPSCAFLFNLK